MVLPTEMDKICQLNVYSINCQITIDSTEEWL